MTPTPHLRIVDPTPADESTAKLSGIAMEELGCRTIAEILGTYQDSITERNELMNEAMYVGEDGVGDPIAAAHVWELLTQAERRLYIYALLAQEAYGR